MTPQRTSGDLLADRRYAYAEACLADGDAHGACEMAEQALERVPRFSPAWFLLGRAREAQHRAGGGEATFHAALRAYANALDIDPEDQIGARLRLVGLGEGEALEAITPAYIRALFDCYAPRFERHLVSDLQYRGPAMLMDALDRVAGSASQFETVVDLGCGTGLVAEALAGRGRHLTGIDLSPAMLAEAERSGRYRRLVLEDLRVFLAAEPPALVDLVLAADVFIYLGDLAPVLAAIARILRPGGLVAFTTQAQPGDAVILGTDGRYAHGTVHLREVLDEAGLEFRLLEEAAIRRERGCDVPGHLVLGQRPSVESDPERN